MIKKEHIENAFRKFVKDDKEVRFSIIDEQEVYEHDGDDFNIKRTVYEVETNRPDMVDEFSKYTSTKFIFYNI